MGIDVSPLPTECLCPSLHPAPLPPPDPPPPSPIHTLKSEHMKEMILRAGDFGRGLGHEGEVLMKRICALVKETQKLPSLLLPYEDTARKQDL